MTKNTQSLRLISLFALVLAFSVIVLGAYTRLVDAGLGCPDWPMCYGQILPPESQNQISKANAIWPEMPVDTSKTWPEMIHRYLATSLGALLCLTAFLGWRRRADGWQLMVALVPLVMLQGAFGAWTVTLKLLPPVVTTHLLGGFLIFALQARITSRLWNWQLLPKAEHDQTQALPGKSLWLAGGFSLLLLAQISLGGWTSANYAAYACPDFPTCQNQWWPETDFKSGFDMSLQVGPNYQGGLIDGPARTAIHMAHRIGAVTVLIIGFFYLRWLKRQQLRRPYQMLHILLMVQIGLGIANVFTSIALPIAVLHNNVGALLFACSAILTLEINAYRVSLKQPKSEKSPELAQDRG